jgi:hypothetical protein
MTAQPTGTVTLLFTDVQGSTRLLGRLGPQRYADALGLHRRLLREAFERYEGYEVDHDGDSSWRSHRRRRPSPQRLRLRRHWHEPIGPMGRRFRSGLGSTPARRKPIRRSTSGSTCTLPRGSWPRATAGRCC